MYPEWSFGEVNGRFLVGIENVQGFTYRRENGLEGIAILFATKSFLYISKCII